MYTIGTPAFSFPILRARARRDTFAPLRTGIAEGEREDFVREDVVNVVGNICEVEPKMVDVVFRYGYKYASELICVSD